MRLDRGHQSAQPTANYYFLLNHRVRC
jgi:hypothetical protein